MEIKRIGRNKREISYTNKTTFLFSYETPVAVRIKGSNGTKCYITACEWSATTQRHIREWIGGSPQIGCTYRPQSYFDKLADKQRSAADEKLRNSGGSKPKEGRFKTLVVYQPTTLMMLPLKQQPQQPTEGESVPAMKIYKVWAFEGSGAEPYQTLQYEDATLSCNCPGWTRRVARDGTRSCKHTRLVQMDMADQVAVKATVIDGSKKPIVISTNSKTSMNLTEAGTRAMRFD